MLGTFPKLLMCDFHGNCSAGVKGGICSQSGREAREGGTVYDLPAPLLTASCLPHMQTNMLLKTLSYTAYELYTQIPSQKVIFSG